MSILQILGHILLGLGGFILFTSGLGVLRMPDVWNRMHAGTKATTLGSMLFLLGIGCLEPVWLPKLLLIILLILLTNPISGHALARAVHMGPEEAVPENLQRNDLKDETADGEKADE